MGQLVSIITRDLNLSNKTLIIYCSPFQFALNPNKCPNFFFYLCYYIFIHDFPKTMINETL
jgi:hypothetical protein